MKLKITFLLFSLHSMVHLKAAIFTVSNIPGSAAQYSQINPAIATAAAGDTIYVKGSNIIYNAFAITKSITILGPGSFSDKQNAFPAKVNNVSFISNISGIKLKGLYFYSDVYLNNILTNISNIEISDNFFDGVLAFGDASNFFNILISNNIFNNVGAFGKINFSGAAGFSNVTIQNNILFGPIYALIATNAVIANNVFVNTPNAFQNYVSNLTTNAIIRDNIFYNSNPTNNTVGCSYLNNLSFNTSSTYAAMPGTGNIDNTNPNFINVISGTYSTSFNFHLQGGSPAIGSSSTGSDIGFYGGSIEATISGEPENVPVIRHMNIQNNNVPQNGNVNVNVRSTLPR